MDTAPLPAPAAQHKSRGRAKTTGRYATRKELCDNIWRMYQHSPAHVADIARVVRVSETVVHKVLDNKEGMPTTA